MSETFRFEPDGDTLVELLTDQDSHFLGVCGPIGSGKTYSCCAKTFMLANSIPPSPIDGVVRVRGAVVRNSFPQLKTTTVKTWQRLFPEAQFGKISWTPPYTQRMRWQSIHPDTGERTLFEQEVFFLALDREEDVAKVLSMELTWAYLNEAREIKKSILDALTGRVGRFPGHLDGGTGRSLIVADTNAPSSLHWWSIMGGLSAAPEWMSEQDRSLMVRPQGFKFLLQPPAVLQTESGFEPNPRAENLKYLPPNYYSRAMQGKTRDWVLEYLCNHPSGLSGGKPIYAYHFSRSFHVAGSALQYNPDYGLEIGLDLSGLSIGAVAGQFHDAGQRLRVIDEMLWTDISIEAVAEKLMVWIANLTGNQPVTFTIWPDPASRAKQPGDKAAARAIDILCRIIERRFVGVVRTNDPLTRRAAVEGYLRRNYQGEPGLLVSPVCGLLIEGLGGEYCFASGEKPKPKKNRHSHVAEALEYLIVGATGARKPREKPSTATVIATGDNAVQRFLRRAGVR